jgi:hypothetical protein
MPDPLSLTGRDRDRDQRRALRGHPLAVLFVRDDGSPSGSFRGSTYARYLAIEGRARVAPELDQEVYDAIVEPERQQDPERQGVAGERFRVVRVISD